MDATRKALAANLAELRKSENLTQAEFAARLNYSDKAVSKWERGDSLPDVVMLKTIADMYHLRVDDLLTENGVQDAAGTEWHDEQVKQKVLVVALWCPLPGSWRRSYFSTRSTLRERCSGWRSSGRCRRPFSSSFGLFCAGANAGCCARLRPGWSGRF